MSLSVGIVGLPNAGKSTLFNSLVSRRQAQVGVHPFTTVKPNTGVVRVHDTNLKKLSKLLKPEKTTSASITFVDIAGLVRGAHEGEGLGNEFLSHIRGVDAIAHVVREFSEENVSHVMGSVDPLRDKEVVQTELRLKDLETLERARDGKSDKSKMAAIEKLSKALDKDMPASSVELTKEEKQSVRHIQLLTFKPYFYILNVSEDELEELKGEVNRLSSKLGECVVVCAKLEEEMVDLEPDERASYRREMGLRGSALDRIIAKAYSLLDLATFYTVKGAREGGEVRAWSISKGASVLQAAEKVHTDFAKGFVAAEVISAEELIKSKGWKDARKKGKIRTEGRDYKVQDGDVIEFKVSG